MNACIEQVVEVPLPPNTWSCRGVKSLVEDDEIFHCLSLCYRRVVHDFEFAVFLSCPGCVKGVVHSCAYLWQHLWQTRRRQSWTRRRILRHSSKHPVSDPRSTSHWQMKCHPRQEGSRKKKYRRRDRNISKAKSIREE